MKMNLTAFYLKIVIVIAVIVACIDLSLSSDSTRRRNSKKRSTRARKNNPSISGKGRHIPQQRRPKSDEESDDSFRSSQLSRNQSSKTLSSQANSANVAELVRRPKPVSNRYKSMEIKRRKDEGMRKTAEVIKNYMNPDVDPCDNFYEYACGGFKNHKKTDTLGTSIKIEMENKLLKEIKEILTSEDVGNIKSIKHARLLYDICVNSKENDNGTGTSILLRRLAEFGYWPLLHGGIGDASAALSITTSDEKSRTSSEEKARLERMFKKNRQRHRRKPIYDGKWDASKFNLVRLMTDTIFGSTYPLVNVHTVSYKRREVLFISKTDTEVLDYSVEGNAERGRQLVRQMLSILRDASNENMPLNEKIFERDVSELEKFQRRVSEITNDLEELQGWDKKPRPDGVIKCLDLPNFGHGFEWLEYFERILPVELHKDLRENRLDCYYEEPHMDALHNYCDLVRESSPRVLTNHLLLHYVYNVFMHMRIVNDTYGDLLEEAQIIPYESEDCVSYVYELLPHAIDAIYLRKQFPTRESLDAFQTPILDVIRNVRRAFQKRADLKLNHNAWMDDATRRHAIEKWEKMEYVLGCTDFYFDDAAVNAYYDGLTFNPISHFFIAYNSISRWVERKRFLRTIERQNSGFRELYEGVMSANGYYSNEMNAFVLKAGVLQPPVYDPHYATAKIYGTLGLLVAHEMTHAVDANGRHFDKDGEVKNWWTPKSAEIFEEKAKLILEQYERYKEPNSGLYVDSEYTLNENIADNVIQLVYTAFKEATKTQPKAQPLPGLPRLTEDQIFFISFAQYHCAHIVDDDPEFSAYFYRGKHAPTMFRVNGSIANVWPLFRRTFKCHDVSQEKPPLMRPTWPGAESRALF